MTTPSGQKRGRAFIGDLKPPAARKTPARAEGGTKKDRFYRPLRARFRHNGFDCRQIAREGDRRSTSSVGLAARSRAFVMR
jgi:hypothetical protein